jgi:hypothetical protein
LTCAEAGAANNTAPTETAANNPDFISLSPQSILVADAQYFITPRLPIYFQ